MRPISPKLFAYTTSIRKFIIASVVVGLCLTSLLVVQANIIAHLITDVFQKNISLSVCKDSLIFLGIVFTLRAGINWLQDVIADIASTRTKSQLRKATLNHIAQLGPAWTTSQSTNNVVNALTTNLDALDSYFSRYLPQLILSVLVPTSLVIYFFTVDTLSTVIVVVTVPLIPFFMVLIGKFTQIKIDDQWESMSRLTTFYSDLLRGLATLKNFNKAKQQKTLVKQFGDDYRKKTLNVLRISFLSSLTLELIATLSVALVAVSIGLRLISGQFHLVDGLIILILAPEVYSPLRLLGTHFHAAQDGLKAAEELFSILETPLPSRGNRQIRRINVISCKNISFNYGSRDILSQFNAEFRSGMLTVVCGPSGSGKSTLANLLLGYLSPTSGEVLVDEIPLSDVDSKSWNLHVGYLPQTTWFSQSTIRETLQLANAQATDIEMISACVRAGLDVRNDQSIVNGLDTPLNRQSGLSSGQRRRLACARLLLQDSDVFVLDEPTATLDSVTEQRILTTFKELAEQGKIVIIISHRPAVINAADSAILVESVMA